MPAVFSSTAGPARGSLVSRILQLLPQSGARLVSHGQNRSEPCAERLSVVRTPVKRIWMAPITILTRGHSLRYFVAAMLLPKTFSIPVLRDP